MELSVNTQHYFKLLNKEYNNLSKEMATGTKNLNSSDFAYKLKNEETLNQLNYINQNISKNELNRNQNDTILGDIKSNIETIKTELIKSNTDTVSLEDKKIINDYIQSIKSDITKKSEGLTKDRLLVSQNNYMDIGLSKNDIVLPTKSLEDIFNDISNNLLNTGDISGSLQDIEDLYNKVNLEHSKIGNQNSIIDNKLSLNSKHVLDIKTNLTDLEATDMTENLLKLNQIELTYQAMASITKTQNELSLVNFI